jgi:hypothetical protein
MQGKSRRGQRRLRHVSRRRATVAGVLVAAGALSASAAAQAAPAASSSGGPTTVVSGDSVVVSSLPSFGPTTITVTRPDAVTGAPVAIGLESGTGDPFTPFTANTITPSPLDPSGDCWQKGALSEALTPDIRPGDTVTVSQAGLFGTGGTSSSTVVQPSDETGVTPGPIAGCASVAPWAQNAITSAPSTVAAGTGLTVSGVAQPLATGVSVSASNGTKATAPISTTPAADGSWSVTIPASELNELADGNLTITPVMAVPNVSTGAAAHIAGVGVSVQKKGAGTPGAGGKPGTGTTKTTAPPTGKRHRITAHPGRVRVETRSSLANARKHGIKLSFVVPKGVHVVRIRLRDRGRSVYTAYVRSHRAGTRQAFTIPAREARRLHDGDYMLAIKLGDGRGDLGPAVTRSVRLTNP